MKSSIWLIVAAVVIILALTLVSKTGKEPPLIPADATHQGIATQEGCAACHAPGKSSPLKENHPPKEQCLVCHKAGKG